jgi:hypothetical protein
MCAKNTAKVQAEEIRNMAMEKVDGFAGALANDPFWREKVIIVDYLTAIPLKPFQPFLALFFIPKKREGGF